MRHLVLMGVSGSGKSTVGEALSQATGLPYLDGDTLHTQANVTKMRDGLPLDDQDRMPWLDRCGAALRDKPDGLILGCSALRRRYRDRLRKGADMDDLLFVLLDGDPALLAHRMQARKGHYMPPSLLQSQLDTLERPADDEHSIIVSIDQTTERMVAAIRKALDETG
ncbi:gluconokinase [Paracoccus albicereus]|uniref:gluconokinase n=1 Tax=Paracoccus albicereus TaxID=2922394 RepID=UPI0021007E53|nr:gluconokinase [Paracoccus albicereus]